MLGFVGRRLRFHSSMLRRLEPRARLPYFSEKSETALRWVGHKFQATYDAILTPRAVRLVHAATSARRTSSFQSRIMAR